jgi:uncharacterized membrane protein
MARIDRRQLRELNFLTIPLCYITLSLLLGFLVPNLSNWFFPELISPMNSSSAIAMLSAIATGMMALTAIVFSMVFLLVQFGSTAYSPRVVSIFARQKVLSHSIGIFTATFLFALIAIRDVDMAGSPGINTWTVLVAFTWVLASVFVLVRLVQGVAALTITNVLYLLSSRGAEEIHQNYPPFDSTQAIPASYRDQAAWQDLPVTQTILYRGLPKYILALESADLVRLASQAGGVVHIPYAVGDVAMPGKPLARVLGASHPISERRLRQTILLGRERTIEQDPKYALRLLVDIAIRALSPAVNDPTTAVMSLNQIDFLLREMGNSQLDIGHVTDEDGNLRLVFSAPSWEDLLSLGLDEIQHYGASSIQVHRRMGALLVELHESLPESRRAVVQRYHQHHELVLDQAFPDTFDRTEAAQIDRQGLGQAVQEDNLTVR